MSRRDSLKKMLLLRPICNVEAQESGDSNCKAIICLIRDADCPKLGNAGIFGEDCLQKMSKTISDSLRKIIELTAYIDPHDNSVWGHDTDLGKIDDILEEAHKIIRPLLKVID